MVRTLDDRSNRIKILAWSQDGQRLLAGLCCGSTEIWNIGTGTPEFFIRHEKRRVTAAAFSPDNRFIAIAFIQPALMDRAPTFSVWDTSTGSVKSVKIKTSGRFWAIQAITPSANGWRAAARFDSHSQVGYSHEIWIGDTGRIRTTSGEQLILKERQRINHGWTNRLHFTANGARLHTGYANLVIDEVEKQECKDTVYSFDLSVRESGFDGSWIYCGETAVLRLPLRFEDACYHIFEDQIAVGSTNGQIFLFTTDREQLVTANGLWG